MRWCSTSSSGAERRGASAQPRLERDTRPLPARRGLRRPRGGAMTDRQPDDEPVLAGVTLTLNPPFVEQYGDAGVQAYCAAVAEVAERADELPPSELAIMLRARLDDAAI